MDKRRKRIGNATKFPLEWGFAVDTVLGIKDVQDRLMMACVLWCGLRVGEVVRVTKRDIMGDVVLVRKTKVRAGGKKTREVPVSDTFRAVRDDCLGLLKRNMDDPLFLNARGGHITRNGVNFKVNRYFPGLEGQVATCHTLRKTVADKLSWSPDGGRDFITPQKYLDHKSPMSTVAYLDTSRAMLAGAVNNRI